MAILTSDIKLLKSAVMADTSDGGGQMTSNVVVDGASNNLFPDTSAMDRAFGRLNLRKVFGVVSTANSDVLMGAHAIITDAPDDPLVHCSILKTSGWADTRTTVKSQIESYMVKSAKYASRIYDTHYTGALQLRLYSFVSGGSTMFPTGGEAIVIRNPNGAEQYARVLKTTITTQQVAVTEGSTTLILTAQVCNCELGQSLAFDVLGAPAQRVGVVESTYASLFSTVVAGGAKFYGIKPLSVPGQTAEYSVVTDGGVYLPLVPAATIESPIIDQFPLLELPGISTAAAATITFSNPVTHTWGPNAVVAMPTLISPGTFSMSYNGTSFTDSADGVLLQGTTAVGTIEYRTGKVTLNAGSPTYGAASAASFTYKPASPSGAACHSDLLDVTLANQGLSFTKILYPIPAKGTFSMSYMAQNRWYTLIDSLGGKITGTDVAYGVGTISYVTGSIAFTLGALPDIGSPIIFQWGNISASQPIAAPMPTKVTVDLQLPANTYAGSVALSWQRSAVGKTATCSAAGVVSGDATGKRVGASLYRIEPTLFPDTNITVNYSEYATGATGVSGFTGIGFTLTEVPVAPGSVHFALTTTPPANCRSFGGDLQGFYDDGAGNIVTTGEWNRSSNLVVGAVNYATGVVTFSVGAVTQWVLKTYYRSRQVWFHTDRWEEYNQEQLACTLNAAFAVVPRYSGGTTEAKNLVVVPNYYVQVPTDDTAKLQTTGLTFTLGGEIYTAYGGVVRKGWVPSTGLPVVASAGSVSEAGLLSIQSFPTNGSNVLSFQNAAIDLSGATLASGVFRTSSAPLKTGNFQISDGVGFSASANGNGDLSGAFVGKVDAQRGYVKWQANDNVVVPSRLRYNTVFLQYLPLDATLLGIETARLPLDGKVPIYRTGDLCVVHNTQSLVLPDPLTANNAYSLGRVRVATVRVKDALGALVPDTLYTTNLDAGTITFPGASNITAYTQPFTVDHRIEDMLLCSQVDISGQLKFTRSLTHDFPANTSFVSSAMPFGDLFSRVYNYFEQTSWGGTWSNTTTGTPTANFNEAAYPITVTNAGAITERWALVFVNTTTFNVIGETVGQMTGQGTTGSTTAPINPATGSPYFSVPAGGWGVGWVAGNTLRFNTDACGTPFWVARTVLQGPASIASDQFTLAFRGDVDTP